MSIRQQKLGIKAYHHHLGVFPSTIPAMVSESQPGPWLFSTKGMRSSSGGGGAKVRVGAGFAPGMVLCEAGGGAVGVGMRVSAMPASLLGFSGVVLVAFTMTFGRRAVLIREFLGTGRHGLVVRHFRVRVAHAGQIGQARLGEQKFEHGIVAVLLLQLGDAAGGVFHVPEGDRFGRAGLLAGGLESA